MNFPKFKPHKDRELRIQSAVTAMRAIVGLDLYPAHKKELLGICIWKLTEADGKYNLRYWSEGSIKAPKKDYRHEHVYEKKELIQRALAGEDLESIAEDAVACVVTPSEHVVLSSSIESGWDRYIHSGVKVFDALKQQWKEHSAT